MIVRLASTPGTAALRSVRILLLARFGPGIALECGGRAAAHIAAGSKIPVPSKSELGLDENSKDPTVSSCKRAKSQNQNYSCS